MCIVYGGILQQKGWSQIDKGGRASYIYLDNSLANLICTIISFMGTWFWSCHTFCTYRQPFLWERKWERVFSVSLFPGVLFQRIFWGSLLPNFFQSGKNFFCSFPRQHNVLAHRFVNCSCTLFVNCSCIFFVNCSCAMFLHKLNQTIKQCYCQVIAQFDCFCKMFTQSSECGRNQWTGFFWLLGALTTKVPKFNDQGKQSEGLFLNFHSFSSAKYNLFGKSVQSFCRIYWWMVGRLALAPNVLSMILFKCFFLWVMLKLLMIRTNGHNTGTGTINSTSASQKFFYPSQMFYPWYSCFCQGC